MENVSSKTVITQHPERKQLHVTREFEAPVDQVWKAWTEKEMLDQWWAPKPWKAKTKSMDFREGGTWMYAMVGPDGTEQWCKVVYSSIEPQKHFSGNDAFCDEDGNINNELPSMDWHCEFKESANGTTVDVNITFSSMEDLEKIVAMRFKEGFTAAHGNLDELLAKNQG